jgi:hypothetical protein
VQVLQIADHARDPLYRCPLGTLERDVDLAALLAAHGVEVRIGGE